ncbi:MAG: four helix bundle protein [Sphingobacteriales bacterium]|nr:four helix bundle protein [Sphingobacteriales bacterium]
MKNFKELIIWQKGIELVKEVYASDTKIPQQEKYGMISQMTRAAVSIPANIAEGSSRNSDKDYSRFLQVSLGSAFELQTYLIIIRDLSWCDAAELKAIEELLEEEIKMLHTFIKKLTANS